MKKLIIIIAIFFFFVIGLKLGDNSFNQNKIFEEEKNRFEQEITTPNNDYEAKELVPQKNTINKVADLFDNTIDKVVDKLKNILKKL